MGTDSGTAGCPDGTFAGPVTVQVATVECLDTDTVRFYAQTEGWTSNGYVFSQETGNPAPNYADNHDLVSYEWDACGFEDNLEQELATGVDLGDQVRNDATLFSCEPSVHYDSVDVMTYAFAVNDVDGNPADCMVFGADPADMVNETIDRSDEPEFDLTQCSSGLTAR